LQKILAKAESDYENSSKYCSGCKVELLFNSDRSVDQKERESHGSNNSRGSSDEEGMRTLNTQLMEREGEDELDSSLSHPDDSGLTS